MADKYKIDRQLVKESRVSQLDLNNMAFGKVYSDHLFIADYGDGKWFDLRIRPYDLLNLTPGSAILHYGQSVFEGLKAYNNEDGDILVFRPEMNAKRLNISSERMCIPAVPEDLFMQSMVELLEVDRGWVPNLPGTALYIRPFTFALDEYIGIKPSDTYNFMIFTCPVGSYYEKALKVKIETEYSRSVQGGTGYAKAAGNYAGSLYPAMLAQKEGYDQLIWTDGASHKYIEEAGTMNIMFLIDDTVVTAKTNDTVLSGITRDSVLTIAKDWGVKVNERNMSVDELIESLEAGKVKEAFGTGTAATITKIDTIGFNGKNYNLDVNDDQSFSSKVLKELNDIRTGKVEDTRGWVLKV